MSRFKDYIASFREWLSGVDLKATWKAIPHKGYIYCFLFMLLIILLKPLFSLGSRDGEDALSSLFADWANRNGVREIGEPTVLDITQDPRCGVIFNAEERAFWGARRMMLLQLKDYLSQGAGRRAFERSATERELEAIRSKEAMTDIDSLNVTVLLEKQRRMAEIDSSPGNGMQSEMLDMEINTASEKMERLGDGLGQRIRLEAPVRDTLVGFVFYLLEGEDTLRLFSVYDPSAKAPANPFGSMDEVDGRNGGR